jgi:hypothetical protein
VVTGEGALPRCATYVPPCLQRSTARDIYAPHPTNMYINGPNLNRISVFADVPLTHSFILIVSSLLLGYILSLTIGQCLTAILCPSVTATSPSPMQD